MPATAQQLRFAPQERNAEGNTAKRHKNVHRNHDMQSGAYKYSDIQKRNAPKCPKKCAEAVALDLFWREAQHNCNVFGLFVTLELR